MTDDSHQSHMRELPGVQSSVRRLKPPPRRRKVSVEELEAGVIEGNRALIGRALSVVESRNPAHREKAEDLLQRLLPRTGDSIRLGISGVPGVGKSTFIEAFGMKLVEAGHRVAVLAVDPTSEVSGGSILGDKTRMERLSQHEAALVRPTPGGAGEGGVARSTREAILVCEAAGYDFILVETIGVGQSETQVASMTDIFLLLMLAGAGDELQGIKRGVLEVADIITVNKADGDNLQRAKTARSELAGAMKLLRGSSASQVQVRTCSSLTGAGIDELVEGVKELHRRRAESGELEMTRRGQWRRWMEQAAEWMLSQHLEMQEEWRNQREELAREVEKGNLLPGVAARRLVGLIARAMTENKPVTKDNTEEEP